MPFENIDLIGPKKSTPSKVPEQGVLVSTRRLKTRLGKEVSYIRIARFEALYFEEPINPTKLKGHTNIDTLRVLSGLAAHAESFGHALGLRIVQGINIDSWRSAFIGRINSSAAKAKAKAAGKSATDSLKSLTIERCRQLGFNPRNTDEADAIGILDYCVALRGDVPPWRAEEVLRPMMAGGAR